VGLNGAVLQSEARDGMVRCYLGLGGNRGDVAHAMRAGLGRLDGVPGIRVTGVSPIYQTAPVGPAAGTFLNATAELACDIAASDLLAELQSVENQEVRMRDTRWGPRTLDLDILLYGDAVVSEPRLTIPHPHMWYRRFVLDPICDLAPDVVHPGFGQTVQQLRELLLRRPFPVMLKGGPHEPTELAESLQRRFPQITLAEVDDVPPEELLFLDLSPVASAADASIVESHFPPVTVTGGSRPARRVFVCALPGSLEEAAASVLTAALDDPARYSRPLRRMP
jgi:2-amino-4-hydroxy-6-hydroxymethyldihydropteridine diphosphokinase